MHLVVLGSAEHLCKPSEHTSLLGPALRPGPSRGSHFCICILFVKRANTLQQLSDQPLTRAWQLLKEQICQHALTAPAAPLDSQEVGAAQPPA